MCILVQTWSQTPSGDDRETGFLFQRLSVLIQRFNAIDNLYSPYNGSKKSKEEKSKS